VTVSYYAARLVELNRYMSNWQPARAGIAALAIGMACVAASCKATSASREPLVRAGECLLLRQNPSNVVGMDVGSSVSIGPGQSRFIFGDTFVGSFDGTGSRATSGAVHSASALVDTASISSCFAGSAFVMGSSAVAQYLAPKGAGDTEMVWPLGPALVHGGALQLLFTWVKPDPSDGLGFKVLGSGIVAGDASANTISVDVHALAAPASEAAPSAWVEKDGFVYLYRCGSMLGKSLDPCIVGRAATTDSATLSTYSYFVENRGYVGSYDEATVVTDGAPAFTVTWNAYINAFLTIYIEPFAGDVTARRADAPEGPFSDKVALWHCSLPADDPKAYCYAAFEHPELDGSDSRSVSITYDTNTSDFASMLRHPNLYWPRLLTVDLSQTIFSQAH
jgi:hypothetical protein